jgi:hypothetical protein
MFRMAGDHVGTEKVCNGKHTEDSPVFLELPLAHNCNEFYGSASTLTAVLGSRIPGRLNVSSALILLGVSPDLVMDWLYTRCQKLSSLYTLG